MAPQVKIAFTLQNKLKKAEKIYFFVWSRTKNRNRKYATRLSTKTKKEFKRASVVSQGVPQAKYAQIGPENRTPIANKREILFAERESVSQVRFLVTR